MKAALFLFIFFLIPALPASAAESFPAGEVNAISITEVYSDIKSFDLTIYSDQPEGNLSLEVLLVRPERMNEEILGRQTFSIDSLPANTRVTKVGFWDIVNPERGAYTLRVRLLDGGHILSEEEYNFAYGTNSALGLQINDLVSNSQGISVAISPKEASLFDIEYMLVDSSNVAYVTKTEKLSLTSAPDVFSATWGTILENNKVYAGRVKIHVYSPEGEFITSTENFTARDDAEITDIFEDETGASATVFGRSQVPFEGSLVFSVYELTDTQGEKNYRLIESAQQRVPVLLNNDDETVEVAWRQRLSRGIYRLQIELLGNDGDVIERRETIIESDLSPVSNVSEVNGSDNGSGTQDKNSGDESDGDDMPGLSLIAGITGLAAVYILLRKN